jgi:oxygen tolerance protein BatD
MKRLTLFTLFFLLVTTPGASSQTEVSVNLNLDPTEATLADSIRMVVSISGSRENRSKPVIKGLKNFTVNPGGTTSRVEIINGKVSAGIDYTFYLQPKNTGTFQIGPAEVKIDGKRYQSPTRTLRVVKTAVSGNSKISSLFLNAEISSRKVYVEEQILYTLKLYNRTAIRDISLSLPEQENLVFTQLGKPREYRRVINGQTYEVLEIRYAVRAGDAGAYVIGPAKMNMTVADTRNRNRRSIFNDPFFGFSSGRPLTLSGESFELTVLPFPETGRPGNFSGLVGKFSIESQLDPGSVKSGESATLTVRVTGRGNVQRIPDLKFPELSDANIYADQPVLEAQQDPEGVGGVKTMKWALVPEKQGRIEVPPMTLSFFDPETKQYQTLKTATHILSVLPSDKEAAITAAPTNSEARDENGKTDKQEIKALGRDILPIHTDMKYLTAQSRILTHGRFYLWMLTLPFFLYMVAFFSLKFKKQKVTALAQTRSKKAAGKFIKRCRKGGLNHQDLMNVFSHYLNRRFALSIGVLTAEEATDILGSKGITPETADALRSILRILENAVYTGKGHEKTDQAKSLADLVKCVEREIR